MKAFVVPSIFTAVDKFTGTVNKMTGSMSAFSAASQIHLARAERSWRKIGDTAMRVGSQTAMITGAIALPLVYATKKAVEFEDQMADVAKTTGMEGESLENFGNAILEMSMKTRTAIDDLVKIGEIGGQLGVAEAELISFTDEANKFNVALGSDFSGGVEEAISSVGKVQALFSQTRDLDISEVIKRTGSAINELGAVGSGTSQNITDFTLRLGALPDALKPSVTNTMALATALEEMGINSEIGARGIGDVITTAGSNLPAFAEQMNMTAEAATALLNTDSTEFMKQFAASFKGMSTIDLADKLKQLKIGDTGTIKVIGALSSGTERLTDLQIIANKAFEEGSSLQNEYNKKNSTAAAQWGIMKNNLQAAAITLGQALLPVLTDLLNWVTPMIKRFSTWAKNNKAFLGTILKVTAGIAAFSGAVSIGAFAIGGFAKAMTAGIQLLTFMVSPLGLIIAGVAALALVVYGVSKAFDKSTASERVNAELQERVLEKTLDQRVEVKMLTDTLRTHNQTSEAYINALKRIEQIQPGITEKYNLQEKSVRAISAAERELTENILKRAEAEVRAEMMKDKIREKLEVQAMSAEEFNPLMFGSGDSEFNAALKNAQIMKLDEEIGVLSKGVAQDQLGTDTGKETWGTTGTLPGERAQSQKIDITVKSDGSFSINQSGDKIGNINAMTPSVGSTR